MNLSVTMETRGGEEPNRFIFLPYLSCFQLLGNFLLRMLPQRDRTDSLCVYICRSYMNGGSPKLKIIHLLIWQMAEAETADS